MASLTLRPPALLQTQMASHTYIITSHITCLSAFCSSLLHYSAPSAPLSSSCPPFLRQSPRLSVYPIPLFPHGACCFFIPLSSPLASRYLALPFLVCCLSDSAFSPGRRSSECSVSILTLVDHICCPLSVSLFGPYWFHQRLFLLVKGLNSFSGFQLQNTKQEKEKKNMFGEALQFFFTWLLKSVIFCLPRSSCRSLCAVLPHQLIVYISRLA